MEINFRNERASDVFENLISLIMNGSIDENNYLASSVSCWIVLLVVKNSEDFS